jgi:hypothetical protein
MSVHGTGVAPIRQNSTCSDIACSSFLFVS